MFSKSFPKGYKKVKLSVKKNITKINEEIVIKKYNILDTEKLINIQFLNKSYINISTLNEIFRNISEKIKEDLAIDLDSFLKYKKLKLKEVAYSAFTNFSVFTKKPVNLKKISTKEKNVCYVTKKIQDINEKKLEVISEAINNARYLQEMPPNLIYPETFANEIIKLSKNIENLSVKVLSYEDIIKNNMGLLKGVGQASKNKPRMVILEYKPDKSSNKFTAFVGKGMTYDAGGYNLKLNAAMRGMKFDLSGAASVSNFLIAAAKLKYKENIVGLCPLAENLIDGGGIKADDVLTSMSGLTVEIVNTDAEGRLIMGDAVYYAAKNYNPAKIITIATLTGAIGIALGSFYTGVFTQYDKLFDSFKKASKISCEPLWRMPLTDKHRQLLLKSRIADILHLPEGCHSRLASSTTAAAFMTMFIKNIPYIHFDIAYTDHINFDQSSGILIKTFLEFCK